MDIYVKYLANTIEIEPIYASSLNFAERVNHGKRMNPIDFGGQRSKVKDTMDSYDKNLVNSIETEPFCVSLSNFTDILTTSMMRRWTLLIF